MVEICRTKSYTRSGNHISSFPALASTSLSLFSPASLSLSSPVAVFSLGQLSLSLKPVDQPLSLLKYLTANHLAPPSSSLATSPPRQQPNRGLRQGSRVSNSGGGVSPSTSDTSSGTICDATMTGRTTLVSSTQRYLQNEQRLRKAVSDVSYEIHKYETLEAIATIDEVKQAECECCGLKEDCTQDYISKVKGSYSGNWVCGLCSEAVKERMAQRPKIAMEEAVGSHRVFCQKFNTTRLNPKLSLTCAMRDIAKRSSENRSSRNLSTSRIARSTSCVPRIDLNH